MKSNHDDGGAAFPETEWRNRIGSPAYPAELVEQRAGMSLLDYFAGEAMPFAAQMSFANLQAHANQIPDDADDDVQAAVIEGAARLAYDIAAAMVAEKRRRGKESTS